VGLFEFMRCEGGFGAVLGCSVDLATPAALKPQLRQSILAEAIYAT